MHIYIYTYIHIYRYILLIYKSGSSIMMSSVYMYVCIC